MQVFTTIYFAEKLQTDLESVEESQRLEDDPLGLVEHRRQRIARLENLHWLEVDDDPDE
jgi:hypothetical protein